VFISKKRAIISTILSIILVIFAMNFVSRNVNILTQRSGGRIVFDYALNIVIFFIIIYLIITLVAFIYLKLTNK